MSRDPDLGAVQERMLHRQLEPEPRDLHQAEIVRRWHIGYLRSRSGTLRERLVHHPPHVAPLGEVKHGRQREGQREAHRPGLCPRGGLDWTRAVCF